MSAWQLLRSSVFGLSGLVLPLQPAMADNHAPSLQSNWYEVAFVTQFPPQQPPSGSATFYQAANDHAGQSWVNSFAPASPELKQALTTANNPFRTLFADLYTPANTQKRAGCPLLSMPVEVDDQPATHEWVIAFSSQRCLYANAPTTLRYGDDDAHKWVLQQNANGSYRVLAEGDGTLMISKRQRQQGYKEIRQQVFIARLYPQHPLQCGGAWLTWHYQQGRYQLAQVQYQAQDCEPRYFPHLQGAEWKRAYARYEQQVRPLIDQWLKNNLH